jgi:hypothetical protein
LGVARHELCVLSAAELPFLPPLTPQVRGAEARILYSVEGLRPLAGLAAARGLLIGDCFRILSGYIRCLLRARDCLLNTAHIGSDPARSVFLRGAGGAEVLCLYAPDGWEGDLEKICRVAAFFAAQEGVLGARTAMGQFIAHARRARPPLKACLKLCESVQREWNYING